MPVSSIRVMAAFGCKWNGARSNMRFGARGRLAARPSLMRSTSAPIEDRFSPALLLRKMRLRLNEGLAEYTGVKLSAQSPAEFAMLADSNLRLGPDRHPNFVRSFAYVSGPAYGFLLDAAGENWRHGLTLQSDLGKLLAHAYEARLVEVRADEALKRARAYDGDELIALETRRDLRQAGQARRRTETVH